METNTMMDRIQSLIKSKGFTPSLFADQIGVQRSGISHILSGRNKPSLDFILKILNAFPDIDADWLLFGREQIHAGIKESDSDGTKNTGVPELPIVDPILNETVTTTMEKNKHKPVYKDSEEVEKIIILYNDKTFDEYKARN